MPPIQKFTKEDIIQKALELIEKEGFEKINARKLAKELNASVQPIFYYFKTMEELKKAVLQEMENTYHLYMKQGGQAEKAYKGLGLSYIKFAKDHPEYFKMLFMQQSTLNAEDYVMSDKFSDRIIKAGQKLTELSYEEQKKFHVKVWIFTHGLACLMATHTITLTQREVEELLERTVREMLKGYRK